MPDTALFIVDVQNGLANSASEIPHAARVRQATETILERARGAQSYSSTGKVVEMYFVQHEEPPNNDIPNLARGTDAWKLVYTPREDETLVSKNTCRQLVNYRLVRLHLPVLKQ
jgi:nicotinamidase-related amidase